MDLPPWLHVRLLAEAGKEPPRHDLSGSGFHAPPWSQRGFPLPDDALLAAETIRVQADVPLRERLAARYGVKSSQVAITTGTTGANLATLLSIVSHGDRVLCERPGYAPLEHLAQGMGAEVAHVARRPDEGWRLHPDDVAASMDGRTRLIVLTSPNNPTGAVASEEDLKAIGRIAKEHDAWVLVDQVYRELTDHPLAARVHHRLLSTAGLNKTWGASGLRTGWIIGHSEAVHRIHETHQTALLAPPPMGENLACILFDHEKACRAALEARLEETHAVYAGWAGARGDPEVPNGLTAFPEIGIQDTLSFAHRMRKDHSLMVLPGEAFGWPGRIRIGLGGDPNALGEALAVLGKALVMA